MDESTPDPQITTTELSEAEEAHLKDILARHNRSIVEPAASGPDVDK